MRRFLLQMLRRLWPRARGEHPHGDVLTAVEYEAVTLIAYEGKKAYAQARAQARYCRERGSQDGFRFWSEVAGEIHLRTKGRIPEQR